MYKILAVIGVVALAASPGLASAQDATTAAEPATASSAPAQQYALPAPVFEYVQQAASMTFDGETMTLGGMAPATIYFSDRPYRMVGHVDNVTFAGLWEKSGGTFAADPPNAAVSVLGEIEEPPAIVELTSVEMDGGSVKYGVRIVSGKLPESADNVALFIDHGHGFGGHGGGGGFHGGYHGGGYPPPHHGGYHPYPPPPPHHGGYYPPYHPYGPYPPYHPYPYHPYPYYPGAAIGAAAVTGAAIGAAAASASQPQQVYVYPVPGGPLPSHCWLNSAHTRMICSVQLANPPQ